MHIEEKTPVKFLDLRDKFVEMGFTASSQAKVFSPLRIGMRAYDTKWTCEDTKWT